MADAPKKSAGKPFTMVRRQIWRSKRFASLPGDSERYLYFYFLTCQHQTSIGCFVMSVAYVLADLKLRGANWTATSLADGMAVLEQAGLLLHDAETGEVLVTQWWKDIPPSNESHFTGAQRMCAAIESPTIRAAAQGALADCWEAFLAARGLPQPPVANSPAGLPSPAERLANLQAKRCGGR